jgi:hypothetical protein
MVDMDVTLVPNAARVYDYMLGGTHNYEADRQAAEFMSTLVPSTRNWVRRLRRFLHRASMTLAAEGFDRFLDLGSGLPTEEHIHASIPHARVVYVDKDPIVVSFGTEILRGNLDVSYIEADIRDLDSILNSEPSTKLLDGASKIAIGFNAITCFLSEAEIAHIFGRLYEWAPSGSKMFATFETKAEHAMTPKLQQMIDMFEKMGSPYHFLTLERAKELIRPWVQDERGFRPLCQWLGDDDASLQEREGVELEFYGVISVK